MTWHDMAWNGITLRYGTSHYVALFQDITRHKPFLFLRANNTRVRSCVISLFPILLILYGFTPFIPNGEHLGQELEDAESPNLQP